MEEKSLLGLMPAASQRGPDVRFWHQCVPTHRQGLMRHSALLVSPRLLLLPTQVLFPGCYLYHSNPHCAKRPSWNFNSLDAFTANYDSTSPIKKIAVLDIYIRLRYPLSHLSKRHFACHSRPNYTPLQPNNLVGCELQPI